MLSIKLLEFGVAFFIIFYERYIEKGISLRHEFRRCRKSFKE